MKPIFTQNEIQGLFWLKIVFILQFSKQSLARLKSKHFSQFFWWELNLRGLRGNLKQKNLAVNTKLWKRGGKNFGLAFLFSNYLAPKWHKCTDFIRLHFTVVYVTNRVGAMIVPGGASHMWCMSKDFLGFMHTAPKVNVSCMSPKLVLT